MSVLPGLLYNPFQTKVVTKDMQIWLIHNICLDHWISLINFCFSFSMALCELEGTISIFGTISLYLDMAVEFKVFLRHWGGIYYLHCN